MDLFLGKSSYSVKPAKTGRTLKTSSLQANFLEEELQKQGSRRNALLHNIIKVTGAEYDWPCHAITTLRLALPTLSEGNIKNRLTELAKQVKQPEDLLFFGPGETEGILYCKGTNREHSAFSSFRSLVQQIDALLPDLKGNLQQGLQNLKSFYEGYIHDLCNCEDNPDRKKYLLAKKVFLKTEKPINLAKSPFQTSTEGLLALSVNSPLTSSYGFYRISQEMARQLISKDRYGFSDKKNKTGMRAVQSQGGVHFKFLDASLDDPRPGLEYMAYAFAKALTPEFLITPSVLLKLEGVSLLDPAENFPLQLLEAKQQKKSLDEALANLHLAQGDWKQFVKLQDHNCFVQASQTIGNKNLAQILEKQPGFQGDSTTMGWQVLFSLLTAPGDGKADNYSVDQQGNRVIGIDNDKAFYPALYQTPSNLYSGINCVFYLLGSLMDEIVPDGVRKSFLSLNPALVILRWLGYLQDQNHRYQRLIDLSVLGEGDLKTLGLPIGLSAELTEQVMNQMLQLQTKLKDHPASTPHHLLSSLHPIVADYYQALRKQYKNDPLGAMWVIYKGRDNSGALQTVDKVLNLTFDDQTWRQAHKARVNPLTDDLMSCVKAFISKIPKFLLRGHFSHVLSLVLHHFKGFEDALLPHLPEDVWHQVIQSQPSQEASLISMNTLVDFLMKRDPAGINRLNAEKKTPLDEAFVSLQRMQRPKEDADLITCLINRDAWDMSFPGKLYRDLKKRQDDLPLSFWQSFQTLQERNAKVGWTMTLEELFPIALKQGQNTIQGASGEIRFLTEDILKQLKDPNREMKQGRRKVIHIEANSCSAYLKFYPELVGLEEAAGELTRRTIGFGAPHGELFQFPDKTPVWVSQGIPGQTLQWVLTHDPKRLTQLDPISTSQFILMAMLINPEDGKPDNYIVEPFPDNINLYRLSCPDNDHGFVPAFVKTKPDKGNLFKEPELVVQVKTVLYCLDQMNSPIPKETKALFLEGDPLVLMEEWLTILDRRNRRYESLYSASEAANLFKKHECFMGIPFQKGMISHLYSKWIRLQDCLGRKATRGQPLAAGNQKSTLTPLELLSKLEPRLANRYREAFECHQSKTILDRFKWVDGDFYHQKGDHWTTLTPSGSILTSQNVPLQEFALESIRNGRDQGPTQAMTELKTIANQKGKTGLTIATMVTDKDREEFLKGFSFGQQAVNEQRNIVKQLVPHAMNLRNLTLKNCTIIEDRFLQENFLVGNLVYLDLNGCSSITHATLPTLSQNMPGLQVLNLTNLPKLRWVADPGFITYGPITFSQLRKLNVNNCLALEAVNLNAPNLKHFWSNGAKKLQILKIKAPELKTLSCQEVPIEDKELYDFLAQMKNLKSLDLNGCSSITHVILSFLSQNMPELQTLNLANLPKLRKIAGPSLITYGPITFRELRKLNVNNCLALEAVDLDAPNLSHFWSNGAKKLQILKIKAPELQAFSCQEAPIEDKELYDLLAQMGNLKSVDITNCPKITQEAKKILPAFLSPPLSSLDLKDNDIGNEGAQALAKNTTLTSLNLGDNNIGNEGVQALAKNTTLKALYLHNNNIGNEGVQALANNITLTSLYLGSNNIGNRGAQALAKNITLKALYLHNNNIGNEGMQALANNITLTSLYLGSNDIGNRGAQALAKNTILTLLSLKNNKVGYEGAQALAKNTTLTSLSLKNNNIGYEGAQALAKNTTFISLDLYNNNIGYEGAQALAKNTTLTTLSLSSNYVGNEGAQALAKNIALTTLSLSSNYIGNRGAQALAKNTTLTSLNLWGNNVGDMGKEALRNSPNPHLRDLKKLGLS